MILCDVNILIYAFREDSQDHSELNAWLNNVLNGDEAYGISEMVLSGFLRVVTHPKVFTTPTPLAAAMEFTEILRSQPHAVAVQPGPHHWEIFTRLCEKTQARGNHIADAYLAALAIESGCEWITADRDYSRYPGLRWRYPLDG